MNDDESQTVRDAINRLHSIQQYIIREDIHPREKQLKVRDVRERLEELIED